MKKTKNIGIIILILMHFSSYSQTVPPPPPPPQMKEFQEDVINLKTENHTNIPFTHIFLKLHKNYSVMKSQTFILKNDEFSGINIIEINNDNHYADLEQYTKENLEKRGLSISEFYKFQLNGHPAFLWLVENTDEMIQSYQLITGDSTYSALLMGYSLLNDYESLIEIREMMLSFVYDKNHVINYEENAPFEYDKDVSDFKFTDATSNFYLFTIGGIKKTNYEDETFINVVTLPNPKQGMTPKSLSMNLKNQIEAQGVELYFIEDSFEKVNNYRAYEVLYRGKQNNKDTELYILTIMNDEFIITIQGRSNNDFKKMQLEMKKFAHSIKIK